MKLTYRGASYDYEPTALDMVDSQVSGQYRGQSMTFKYPRHIPMQPVMELKYRGVAYATTETGGTRSVAVGSRETKPAVPNLASQAPSARARQQMLNDLGLVHRQNIQRTLQHRLEVAKQKGDSTLVSQLENEMQLFA